MLANESGNHGHSGEPARTAQAAPAVPPRAPLVLLVHRIPYPPNKGDKIRSYHLLRYLAERYDVYLGAFVDDAADFAHAETLRQWCRDVFLEPLGPLRARVRMLAGLVHGRPLSVAAYRSTAMRRWVRRTAQATGATRVVTFSTAMAQYADAMPADARRVLDMVDVDSDKWRQYGERRRGPLGWIYRREAGRLLACERAAAGHQDMVTLVSGAEAELFRGLAPESADRLLAVSNGVDCAYFEPSGDFADPCAPGVRSIVFTGAMDYWPNVDAVTWFVDEVLPAVRSAHPDAVFHIVGIRPAPAVRALAARPGVEVVGGVPDMRPWLAHAQLIVAPLRVARGIQNKVLEGFAMARPVLATPNALEGLDLGSDYPLCAERPAALARLAVDTLRDGAGPIGERMRAWVLEHYDWERRLAPMGAVIDGPRAARPAPLDRAVAQRP